MSLTHVFAPTPATAARTVMVIVNSSLQDYGPLFTGLWRAAWLHVVADGGLAQMEQGVYTRAPVSLFGSPPLEYVCVRSAAAGGRGSFRA